MNSRDFAYWLQGFFELSRPMALTVVQTEIIKRHLNMVFAHDIDPSHGDTTGLLSELHSGAPLARGGLKEPVPPAPSSVSPETVETLRRGLAGFEPFTGGDPALVKVNC